MQSAIQNAISCLHAGEKYYTVHSFTKKMRWAYSVESQTDETMHAWELKMRWRFKQSQRALGDAAAAADGGAATANNKETVQTPPAREPKPPLASTRQGRKQKETEPGQQPAQKKARKGGDKSAKPRGLAALKGSTDSKAKAMRNSYSVTQVQAASMQRELKETSCVPEADIKNLEACLESCKKVISSDSFFEPWLKAIDLAAFRKEFKDLDKEQFNCKLDKFCLAIDQPLLNLIDVMFLIQGQINNRKKQGQAN